jgi:hypothetical protein
MPPTSDGENVRTVGCSLVKLIPNPLHLQKIRDAVATTHKATILASELLNLHIRRALDSDPTIDLSCSFSANWVLNAYNEVTSTTRKGGRFDPALRATREACMPPFFPPPRGATQQCLLYDARNLVTVAATNVWMHFSKRILSHVRTKFALDEDAYNALSKDQRRHRKLELMQMASDLCRSPGSNHQSPTARHAWVAAERTRLGIDTAVGDWKDKPLLYHLKAKPHRFLNCMRIMSMEKEGAGGKAFGLYPIRRTNVPRHARFDQKALRDILGLGSSDHIKQKAKERRKRKRDTDSQEVHANDDLNLPPLQPDGVGYESSKEVGHGAAGPSSAPPPKPTKARRTKAEMNDEQIALFSDIVDLRAAGVQRRQRFDFAFTTDGVCARVQMRANEAGGGSVLAAMPKHGVWAIDQLKHAARVEELHVVGVDPGKRELVNCVDMDDTKGCTPVRYTLKQRQRDLRSRQYADEAQRGKPQEVKDAEAGLAGFHSRTGSLADFRAYCTKRHETLDECLAFYADIGHRSRRWKTVIKMQKSEERLYQNIEKLKKDSRPLVLAYGSWGMIAGRPGMVCNKGNAPCIGVGLMRKLARRFVVAPTPEAYTSKTCCRCLGEAGPWVEVEEKMGKKIRGLRRCTQRDCMIPLNRDKNGATNIGTNFTRLMADRPPIRSMTDEDLAFHRASLCLECD